MSEVFNQYCGAVPLPLQKLKEQRGLWRKEDPVLNADTKQVITGGMFPHQTAWWNLENFIKIMVGGYGSGKTMILMKRMIALALTNAPCPVAVVSPTYPVARQTTIITAAELLEGKRSIYGKRLWWDFNNTTHTFTIKFKGREAHMIIYSGERPLSLRGPNLAAAGIDEPFIQEQEVFDQMIARVRHPQAVVREINATGTPEQLNWGYDLCVGDLGDRHDVGMITASTRGNLVLDSGYVDRLEGAFSDKAAEAYIEGKFVSLSQGTVYYAFDPEENIVDIPVPEDAELGCGMDFNVNPMAATVFWRKDDHLHFIDEIELPNADTEFMCSELKERYWDLGLREVFPDATGAHRSTNAPGGKSDHHFIRMAGFSIRAKSANPLRKDRYNSVNAKFKPKAGKLSLTISSKCKMLKKSLSIYTHELMRKQEHLSHLLDAMSYPIAFLFPIDRSIVRAMRMKGT